MELKSLAVKSNDEEGPADATLFRALPPPVTSNCGSVHNHVNTQTSYLSKSYDIKIL